MSTSQNAGVSVFFSGNKGLDTRGGGGVRFDYVTDKATGRKDVPTLIIGGKPRGGHVPWYAKALHMKAGEKLGYSGDKITNASVVEEQVAGGSRFVLATYDRANPKDLLIVKTGLDYEQGSTANHKDRLENSGVTLRPHGIVPFDEDAIRILLAESADLSEILNDPSLAIGNEVRRLGNVQNKGRLIPSIGCPEVSTSSWAIGRKGAAMKGYITGEVVLIRRIDGQIVEKPLPASQRALFERLLLADREKQRKEVIALRKAAQATAEASATKQ